MSKRTKPRTPSFSPSELRVRVERAVAEERYQHALEMAKQLYQQDPSAPHQELLQRARLGRAQQLRKQNSLRDDQAILDQAVQAANGDPAWLERLAEELALCGC